ncbi:MAG: class I SAM-dependent DNA methyltransferase [Candidatus Gracilibacteria bacterium]
MTSQKHLHEKLWAAAEHLRANGSLKLNEISEPILGLIFLKFADVRFMRAKKEIEEARQSDAVSTTRSRPTSPDDYISRGVLYISEKATYTYLMSLPESENIGKAINEAMKTIETENRELAGVLPQDYTAISKKTDENSKILITLLKTFNQIPDDIDFDAFGSIYEYFLGEFARSEGQGGGEFFTPQPIVKLLVEVLEPYHGRIYDPACGSGGMFVQSAHFVAQHVKGNKQVMEEVAICGQEKGETNVRIAKMNLAIHGLSGKIALANSFYEDIHSSIGKFDFVLANPPFNVKGKDKNGQLIIDPARIKGDPRYNLGLPVTQKGEITNANYLWLQMFASALSPQGRAGFVMANSASDAGNEEKKIRQQLIESGIVDVIVSVGTNMFLNATLSCTLWFFDRRKVGTPRQNKILFINAQDLYTEIDRAHNTWTDAQIAELSSIVRRYREEDGYETYEDIKGRCRAVTLDIVKDNNFSLNPSGYIAIVEKEMDDVDFEARMKELMSEFASLTREAHVLEGKIQGDWKSIM